MTGAAWLEGQLPASVMLKNWGLALAGNAAGSLGMVALFATSGVFSGPASVGLVSATLTKTSLSLPQVMARAVLCNWLVCMAIWQATSAQTSGGKFVGVFLPISAFVSLGLEHSVCTLIISYYNGYYKHRSIILGRGCSHESYLKVSGMSCAHTGIRFSVCGYEDNSSMRHILSLLHIHLSDDPHSFLPSGDPFLHFTFLTSFLCKKPLTC
eukprot:jgi/Botrbrau1/2377/Bobra.0395s0011.1